MPDPSPCAPEPLPECLHRIRALEQCVYLGNGQPSHAARISSLETSRDTHTWLLRTILATVIANTAGLLYLVVRVALRA